ncbi:hypothetical protein [Ahrensia sp. 13_GOM-1096m]|uniref:hypothetical protein n=1 Tax=Ahrensia sp. 13_GOM-1096m TaxID=1380380 RepID=UPI00047891FE|nr:hypothetical protein [Ahrensia sp. 13_GOM-1096m]
MMLPDFSSKKHKKSAKGRWPSGFKSLAGDDLAQDETPVRGFEPSIKQELSAFPHMPKFTMDDEEPSFASAPMQAEVSFEDDLSLDTPLAPEPFEENPLSDLSAVDPVSAAENLISNADNVASSDTLDDALASILDQPKATNIGADAVQTILDRVDQAVKAALEPLKFEFNQSVLSGFQSVLRKSIEQDGKQRIVDFIATLVPTANDLVATIKGPAELVEGLQKQLEAREDLPVKIKFVEDNGLLDIVVTYDTASVSTRLAEFEALIAELS